MSSLVNELGICCKIIKVLKYSFNSLTKSEPKKKNAIKASKRDRFSHQNTTAVSEKRCRLSFDWCLNVFNLFYFRYSLIRCLNGVFAKKTIDCKLKTLQCFQSDVCRSSSGATHSPNNQPECLWERLNPGRIRLQRTRCCSLSLLLWANADGWRLLSQHISQPLSFSSRLRWLEVWEEISSV